MNVDEDHGDARTRRLRSIVDNTTNMVVVTNRQREIVWVNEVYTRVTGWRLDEVAGRNPRSFLHGPRTNWSAVTRLAGLLARGEPVADFELLNYKKSGEVYWVSLNIQPVFDDRGETVEYVSIQTDITERKRREAEMLHTQHRLEQAQHLGRLAWLEHELSTGRVVCSQTMRGYLGIAGSDDRPVQLADLTRFVHPDDAARVRAAYGQAINDGTEFVSEHRFVGHSGETRWVAMRGTLEGWEDGRPAVMRMVAQDITERKLAETLAREKQLLEQASRSQLEILSRVTHELRTPLHAVLGFAEILDRNEGPRIDPRSRAHLQHIRDEAGHLLHLVNDILDFVRLRGHPPELRVSTVDLQAIAADVVAMLEPVAAAHDVRVGLAPPGPPIHATADPRRLRQVLINLVGNAIKFSRAGGEVTLAAIFRDDGWTGLEVRDAGPGIEPRHLPQLFEPFYRVPGAGGESESDLGSGLGLAIAKTLVERMNGEIAVESTPGKGSRFRVWLPASAGRPPLRQRPHGSKVDRSEKTWSDAFVILCVDDSEVVTTLLQAQIADRPHWRLNCRGSVATGLQAARELQPDLILLDLQLPDGSGFDLLRSLQAEPALAQVPCIAFSAAADEASLLAALTAGFREFLRKPCSRAEVLALIERMLTR